MNQPPPEDVSSDRSVEQLQVLADELRSPDQWRALLARQLAAVTRRNVLAEPLPRIAEFAGIVERGAFAPRNPAAVTPVVVGTELRPDDDVREMDATIPRSPDFAADEESLDG